MWQFPACDSLRRGWRTAGLAFMAVDALLTHGPPNAWLSRRINRAAMPSVGRAERARILPNAIARLVSLLHIAFTVRGCIHEPPPLLSCSAGSGAAAATCQALGGVEPAAWAACHCRSPLTDD